MKNPVCTLRAALLALCVCAAPVHANVVIGGTRVVFPAQDGETTLRLTNDNTYPALIEAWIDRGDEHSTPDKVDTPFLITPPIFRMEPHKDQSLRIIATPAQLPADRESLFWLNVLEVPPKPAKNAAPDKNMLQFALRSRLKLFYRPANLPGDPLKAPQQLSWKLVADGSGYALEAHNPTAYHVTIVKLTVSVGGQSYSTDTAGMVDPLGSLRMPIKGLPQAPKGSAVGYDIINDYGATVTCQGTVAP